MRLIRVTSSLVAMVALVAAITWIRASASKTQESRPELINTCLITGNVGQLTDFYTRAVQIPARKIDPEYVEFHTRVGVLAIFSADAQENYIPQSAKPAENKSAILEFEVADVDQEFRRLQSVVKVWVKPPTTQPWGTRSIYFRDPDGNLVDFYAWVKRQ
jgi:uncharacterized glyoxalase superfamily protein PhnB